MAKASRHRDPHANRTDLWIATCYTESVNLKQMTITLTVDGITKQQTTLIHPLMPTWILQPGTEFGARIPRRCIHDDSLLTVEWCGFEPHRAYKWTDEDEMFDIFNQTFEESMSAIKQDKLYLVVFDGNPGGDWWASFDVAGNEYEGDTRLRGFRGKSLDGKLHRGAPVGVKLPEYVLHRAEWGSLYWYRSEVDHTLITSKSDARF